MSEPRTFLDGRVTLFHDDCREVLRGMADNSVDSVVTDPPYHLQSIVKRFGKVGSAPVKLNGVDIDASNNLCAAYARQSAGFMGKQWDGGDIAFQTELWAEVLRVLKPGATCLSFGSDRTEHLVACAMEEAGFEIQGKFLWVTGQGFPKSRNISAELLSLPWCACDVGTEVPPDICVSSGPPPHNVSTTSGAELIPMQFDGLPTNSATRLGNEFGCSPRHGCSIVNGCVEELGGNFDPIMLRSSDVAIVAKSGKICHDVGRVQFEPESLRNEVMSNEPNLCRAVTACSVASNDSGSDILPSAPFVRPPATTPCGIAAVAKSIPIGDGHASARAVDGLRITERKKASELLVANDADESRSPTFELGAPGASERNRLGGVGTRCGAEFTSGKTPEEIDSTLFAGFGRHAKIIADLASERKVLICERCGSPKRPEWVHDGLGTGIKPAVELIIRARKPISESSIAANVLRWGVGAINVAGCRVQTNETITNYARSGDAEVLFGAHKKQETHQSNGQELGRWPSNLLLDNSDEVLACFPDARSSCGGGHSTGERGGNGMGYHGSEIGHDSSDGQYNDSGSAARFFASFPQEDVQRIFYTSKANQDSRLGSKHPTVKPLDLIQYQVRLITPKNGVCLDLFAGSGTTGEACFREGFRCIMIEREDEYIADIERRMSLVMEGPDTRKYASMKARNRPRDDGPLFGGSEEPPRHASPTGCIRNGEEGPFGYDGKPEAAK